MRVTGKGMLTAIVGAGGLAIVLYAALPADPLRNAARRSWKDAALSVVRQRGTDEPWRTRAVGALASTRPAVVGGWVGDEILTMRNGDWIVCRNICRKEDKRIHDLFLGYGSDGRWYYSTFHFCVHKVTLMNESQPADLGAFVRGYWLTPFDGKSDECLKITWTPGQPYGEER